MLAYRPSGRPEARSIDGFSNSATLSVNVGGLSQLTSTHPSYGLVGSRAIHPSNHFALSTVINSLVSVADGYYSQVAQQLLFNDMSLVQGGLFEINGNWTTPHQFHRLGRNCDISLPSGGKFDENTGNWSGGHAEHRVGRNCDVNVCGWSQDRKTTLWNMFGDPLIGQASGRLDECPTNSTWHITW